MYLGIMLQPVLILRQKTLINKQTKQICGTLWRIMEQLNMRYLLLACNSSLWRKVMGESETVAKKGVSINNQSVEVLFCDNILN